MKEKALLVASFGTTYKETREKTIAAVEKDLAAAFPDYDVKRTFTSEKIIRILKSREGIVVDTTREALENIYQAGYKELIVQPLHILNGFEYHDVVVEMRAYAGKFESMKLGAPLLSSSEDYNDLVKALVKDMPEVGAGEAVVLMGHGTAHPANSAYPAMEYTFKRFGYNSVYVGMVEGAPELSDVMEMLERDGIKKVTLMPLMLVAGNHVELDMAGDEEDSWKSILTAAGYQVETILKGIGEVDAVRQMYVEHAQSAVSSPYFNRK